MVNRQHEVPGAEPLWWRDTYRGGLKMKFWRLDLARAGSNVRERFYEYTPLDASYCVKARGPY